MRQRGASSSSSAAETGPLLRISGDASALCARLAAFRREGKLVDCIVRVEGSCDFPAHRNVLASSSDYMDALFASGMRDSDDTVITLDGISSHHCQALLDWMYEGTCNVCEGSLLPLLEQAAWLQMQSLQDSLASALKERLTAENVIGTWLAADRLALPALATAATETAVASFGVLAAGDGLLSASKDMLCTLLQNDGLIVESEEVVYRAVAKWAEQQPPASLPEEDLLAVLRHVRFTCMPMEFVQSTVRAWPKLRSPAGQALLLDAMVPAALGGPRPSARRKLIAGIAWQWRAHHSNLSVSETQDGIRFVRASKEYWDLATGSEPLTSGIHQWSFLLTAGWCSPQYAHLSMLVRIGCIPSDADFGSRSGSVGDSPSGILSGFFLCPHRGDLVFSGVSPSHEVSPYYLQVGSRVHVSLDMDARTLSFSFDDQAPRIAFTNLPSSLRPCVVSGAAGDTGLRFRADGQ